MVSSGLASSPETHIHDGHHHQQTHGKTWCSWTCQAGNGLQGFTPLIPKCCFHIVPVHQDNPPIPHLILFIQRSSRAPPAS
ncbi:MAG TPA: hypothetical protein PKZ24_05010, partial [Nitrospirales bacterium]|nr:hypothetical protein [Nitrospirales bacterium]